MCIKNVDDATQNLVAFLVALLLTLVLLALLFELSLVSSACPAYWIPSKGKLGLLEKCVFFHINPILLLSFPI